MKTEYSNKLIAEFMGYVPKEAPANKEYQHNLASISQAVWDRIIMENPGNCTDYFDLSLAEYHTSWNWLMPVVENIEALDGSYVIEIFARACIISYMVNHNWPEDKGIVAHFNASNTNSKLEATYQAVVQFIQWYNQNH